MLPAGHATSAGLSRGFGPLAAQSLHFQPAESLVDMASSPSPRFGHSASLSDRLTNSLTDSYALSSGQPRPAQPRFHRALGLPLSDKGFSGRAAIADANDAANADVNANANANGAALLRMPGGGASGLDVPQLVRLLQSRDSEVEANAAAYLQHLVYRNPEMKERTRWANGLSESHSGDLSSVAWSELVFATNMSTHLSPLGRETGEDTFCRKG
ncbi:unnamed protein product [Protopolystoma xenopodis]|uniref:Uncharacterized protein n=1 Tax=Protopolystoma xenopodis TaxID=117903 RepID=A0A3S5CV20_9PLAT|nr:unnamed protein product [Protopolystoma xenopodis]